MRIDFIAAWLRAPPERQRRWEPTGAQCARSARCRRSDSDGGSRQGHNVREAHVAAGAIATAGADRDTMCATAHVAAGAIATAGADRDTMCAKRTLPPVF